jgi:hypothetical protein
MQTGYRKEETYRCTYMGGEPFGSQFLRSWRKRWKDNIKVDVKSEMAWYHLVLVVFEHHYMRVNGFLALSRKV